MFFATAAAAAVMEHSKKYILVPPSPQGARAGASEPKSVAQQLDDEMIEIANRKQIENSLKWKLYTQTLQKYMHFKERENQPFRMEFFDETEVPMAEAAAADGREKRIETIISMLAPSYKAHARGLLKYARDLDWDDSNHRVVLKGREIERSSIVDIVKNLVSPSSKKLDAEGIEPVVTYLKEINAPTTFIRNKKYKESSAAASATATNDDSLDESTLDGSGRSSAGRGKKRVKLKHATTPTTKTTQKTRKRGGGGGGGCCRRIGKWISY